MLGIGYQYGNWGVVDLEKALFWYRKAAEQGSEAAQKKLGQCYMEGIGVEKDEYLAFYWLYRADPSWYQGH